MSEEITGKKVDHVGICLKKPVEAKKVTTLLECVHLIHNALPELNIEAVDTSTVFLEHKFSAPLLIDAMTGGFSGAKRINENLASAAEKLGIGMIVGSQRAGLLSPSLAETYSIARKKAPNAFIASNIGAAQLVKGFSKEDAKKCIEMIDANAFVVHLNPLQEMLQIGGDPHYEGVLNKIRELTAELGVPIIVKEVGGGISKEVAIRLELAGVKAINVSGAGGTSWAAVEHHRAKAQGDKARSELGEMFWDWGIPTAASLMEVRKAVAMPLIASGGIRSGLDVAKCITLGASLAGMALPLLKPATTSEKAVLSYVERVVSELKTAMFVAGYGNISSLSKARYVLTGQLVEWLRAS